MVEEAIWTTPYVLNVLFPALWERFLDITLAVFRQPQMVWIVTPLIATMLLMEFYFGRYKKEELGWNTAVGNSIMLIFVSIDLLRQLYSEFFLIGLVAERFAEVQIKTFIALFIFLEGLTILAFNFFHALPKRLAFSLSSVLSINFTAYMAIVLIYTDVPMSWSTFWAGVMLLTILKIVFDVLKMIEPEYIAKFQGNKLYRLLDRVVKAEEKIHMPRRRKKRRKKGSPFFREK